MEYFNIQEMGLPDDIWSPFAHIRRPTPYRTGQLIYLQDTPADGFYYLQSGRVRTFISSEDGSEKVLTVYRAGNLFGEASFFDRLPRMSSAVAAVDCQVVRIGREDAARVLADDPQLAWALLQYLARTVRMLSTHVDDMSFRPARQRVIRYLLSLPRTQENAVACTQEEIAAAVGTSRVTVSRVVNQLAKEDLLETGYGFLRLLNPQRFQDSL